MQERRVEFLTGLSQWRAEPRGGDRGTETMSLEPLDAATTDIICIPELFSCESQQRLLSLLLLTVLPVWLIYNI